MNDEVDTLALLTITVRLLCAGVALQSIELLANARELRDDGLLGWQERRGRLFGPQGRLRQLHAFPACVWVLALRAAAALAGLVLPLAGGAMPWCLAALFATHAYYNHRMKMVHEGSDSMFLIGLGAVLAAAIDVHDSRMRAAALFFFAGQVLLAYGAAGWDKLRAPAWRDGTLPTRALQHGAHRFEPLGDFFAHRPAVARVFSWHVILLELLFPLCVVLPPSVFWLFAGAGVLFHGSVAFCMGLHGFFWSFVAAYPAIYFTTQSVAGWLHAVGGCS